MDEPQPSMAVLTKRTSPGAAPAVQSTFDSRSAATLAIWLIIGLFAAIAVRNALVYPPIGGYDAAEHIAYTRSLIDTGELPFKSGTYYTPPLWYVLAGAAMELGDGLGMSEPERMGQLLDALLTVATAVLVVVLARTVFPGRPLLAVAALVFFVAVPTTLRMATMFHPQALVLFLSTAALLVVARMIRGRRYGLASAGLAGVLLGAAELVRSVALWSFGVALLALLVVAVTDAELRRRAATAFAIVLVLGVAIPLPWYVYLQTTYGHAIFGRPPTTSVEAPASSPPPADTPSAPPASVATGRPPASFWLSAGFPEVLTQPHRLALERSFWPTLYADTWGDAFGAWAWGPTRNALTVDVEHRLALQSVVGIPLTSLAGAGWLALGVLAVRRRRGSAELTVLVALPATALAGLVYYGFRSYEPDVDFIKGMFLLTAVPFWGIAFGFAADGLWHRLPRPAGLVLGGIAAACLLVCLEFGLA